MGTQQLLLIVLGVIIVGVAIAVGITIFNNQAYNSNASALSSEAQNYATQAIQYWKTPVAQGGAGTDPANLDIDRIRAFMNFEYTAAVVDDPLTPDVDETAEEFYGVKSENGFYRLTDVDNTDMTVTIVGIGTEKRADAFPKVTTLVSLIPGTITGTPGTASSQEDF